MGGSTGGLLPDAAPTVLYVVSYWAPPTAPSVNNRLLQYSSNAHTCSLLYQCYFGVTAVLKCSQPDIIEFKIINATTVSCLITSSSV